MTTMMSWKTTQEFCEVVPMPPTYHDLYMLAKEISDIKSRLHQLECEIEMLEAVVLLLIKILYAIVGGES